MKTARRAVHAGGNQFVIIVPRRHHDAASLHATQSRCSLRLQHGSKSEIARAEIATPRPGHRKHQAGSSPPDPAYEKGETCGGGLW